MPREKVLKWTTEFFRLSQGRINTTVFLITRVLWVLLSKARGRRDTLLFNFAKYSFLFGI